MDTQEVKPQPKCSICYKVSNLTTCDPCSQIFTSIIKSITTIPTNPLSNIDNLVFQGGGVKGAAYFGVLKELNEEEGFLGRVKRVAGSSAGSIVALYLALNLNLDYIKKLVEIKYYKLLDEGMILHVKKGENKYVSAKTVFLTAIQYFEQLKEEVHDEKQSTEALQKVRNISADIKAYYTDGLRIWEKGLFNLVAGNRTAEAFTSCILDLLGVSYVIKDAKMKAVDPKQALFEQAFANGLLDDQEDEEDDEDEEYSSNNNTPQNRNEIFFQKKVDEIKDDKEVEDSDTEESPESSESDETPNNYRVQPRQNNRNEMLTVTKNKIDKIISFDLKDKNDRRVLHYALAELLLQIKNFGDDRIEYKYDTNKLQPKMKEEEITEKFSIPKDESKKESMGVFSGDKVRKKLIMEPIEKAFENCDQIIDKEKGPTFAQMAAATEENKKCFKDLYVTAFNCATNRTEVFSPEHTPNVFVADAVRASMSIPGFFKPVKIAELGGGNRKIFYKKDDITNNEDVLFMDGGILDNYPLWIFDDIKYLLPASENKVPPQARNHRFTIQNPRTLGFKLLNAKTIERYTEPYIDNDLAQLKRINETSQTKGNKWSFVFGSLLGAKMDQEENEFIKFGNCPRTVYVDNEDVSAIAFDMKDEVVNKLIANGEDSVRKYRKRYEKSFLHEGQAYPEYNC